MAYQQGLSSSGSGSTSGEEKMRGLKSQGALFSQPSFPDWAYNDFTLYDNVAGDEDLELDTSEIRAGLYPRQLILEDASYREHEPPATYCSDACEHAKTPQGVVYDDPSPATIDSSLYPNAGSSQAIPAGSHDHFYNDSTRSFRIPAATPFSTAYPTTATLPHTVSRPTQLAEWNSTPQRHEDIAYRLQRPHLPAANTTHTEPASSRPTASPTRKHHRSISEKKRRSKRA